MVALCHVRPHRCSPGNRSRPLQAPARRARGMIRNMESLTGKVAIVTGGTRGIGRAITERLLDSGAKVAMCGSRQETVDRATHELAGRGKLFGVAADIRRVEDVRTLFAAVD